MNRFHALCPRAPDWSLDWPAIDRAFDWVRAMRDCPQDPEWHAEGDVWVHTQMVVQALISSERWRVLGESDRFATFLACLLHDVEKPSTTRTDDDGRIRARHHSRKGAIRARQILWSERAPFELRELVCNLVLHHQAPFFLTTRDDAERLASRISLTARCDLLAIVAEADARGRECADQSELIDNVELFRVFCDELGCLEHPRSFPSDAHRVEYFRTPGRHAAAPAPTEHRCTVTVMSGLPGSGKDHWLARHSGDQPVVAPDDVRRELGVSPTGDQGRVVHTCRDRAREHLRAGRDFAWNATNLSLQLRSQVLELIYSYGARARVVYVETNEAEWLARNRKRADPIPMRALEKMRSRWQVPDLTEAHVVEYVIDP